jgi:hypothetical protein
MTSVADILNLHGDTARGVTGLDEATLMSYIRLRTLGGGGGGAVNVDAGETRSGKTNQIPSACAKKDAVRSAKSICDVKQ